MRLLLPIVIATLILVLSINLVGGSYGSNSEKPICTWIEQKGGWNNLTSADLLELLDAYLGVKDIGFKPTYSEVLGCFYYYRGWLHLGNLKTGCNFSTTSIQDSYEPDNTYYQAKTIKAGEKQKHSIVPASDVDWVKFTLTTTSSVVIETSGKSGDTRMWLYDSRLNLVEYDDDGGEGYWSRISRELNPGTYYVKIDEYGNNNEINAYYISLEISQVSGDSYEPDDSYYQASTISEGEAQKHSIVPANDVDWIKFTLSSTSVVVIETSGTSGDTRMWLYDSSLKLIEYDDDGGVGYWSKITRKLSPGTYYVKIDEYGNNNEIDAYYVKLEIPFKFVYGVKQRVRVYDVVDGDTIDIILSDGLTERVRLLGVDTPEIHSWENKPNEYDSIADLACLADWGIKAKKFAENKLEGKDVYIEFDNLAGFRGYYGRLLAYVYLQDGTDFNAELLKQGYARAYTEGSFRKESYYVSLENEAKSSKKGLWSCKSEQAKIVVYSTPSGAYIYIDGQYKGITPKAIEVREGSHDVRVSKPGYYDYTERIYVSAGETKHMHASLKRINVRISYVHYDAAGNDNYNLNDEYVVIKNYGSSSISLDGWKLRDEYGHTYVFPVVTLKPGCSATIYSGSGTDVTTGCSLRLYWGRSWAVWNNDRDTAYLYDSYGNLIDSYSWYVTPTPVPTQTYTPTPTPTPYEEPELYVYPTSIDFGTISAGETISKSICIENTGSGVLNWNAYCYKNWIEVYPTSGSLSGGEYEWITVKVDASNLGGRYYYGYIYITSNGGSEYVSIRVHVKEEEAVRIKYVHYNAAGNDNYNLNDEYVVIENYGTTPVNLYGWKLKDRAGHIYYFPYVTLNPGSTIKVHSGTGTNTFTDLYWGRTYGAIWNNDHDTAYLYNSKGELVDSYSW